MRARTWPDLYGFLGIVALGVCFLTGISDYAWIPPLGAILFLAGGAASADWFRSRLVVSESGLTIQRLAWRRDYEWSDIERCEVDTRWWGYPRAIPVVVLRTGGHKRLWFQSGFGWGNKRVHELGDTITGRARGHRMPRRLSDL